LIQGEHPVNPKNIKIEKIVASKRIFSKIELSLEKIEANKYEGKLEHRICYQFEKEK
jgi:acetolactate synthase regulatory subunit